MLEFFIHVDFWVFKQINSVLTQPLLDVIFFWLTDLHKTTYFKIIAVPLVAFLFIRKLKREGISLTLILFLTLGVNDFLGGKVKKLVMRERPENNLPISAIKRSEAGGYSFYSNHSSNMFAFATFTVQFIPQVKIPLFTLAALVAYSRVYNGVHYPSDIIFGALMGALIGLIFSIFARKILIRIKSREKPL